MEGAHRSDLLVKEKSATEFLLSYKPHEPGIYLLNVMFGDEHVTGDCCSSDCTIKNWKGECLMLIEESYFGMNCFN